MRYFVLITFFRLCFSCSPEEENSPPVKRVVHRPTMSSSDTLGPFKPNAPTPHPKPIFSTKPAPVIPRNPGSISSLKSPNINSFGNTLEVLVQHQFGTT